MEGTRAKLGWIASGLMYACALPPSAELSAGSPGSAAQHSAQAPSDAGQSPALVDPQLDPWRARGPSPCPEIEPDLASLRFGTLPALDCARRNTCRMNPKLVGASEGEIYAYLDAPLRCEGDLWIYQFNGDCSQEHDILLLMVADGQVEGAQLFHYLAGEPSEGCVQPPMQR